MGFYKTAPESECHAKTHPPSKNRVWDFSKPSRASARQFAPQVLDLHREKRPTATIIVSGVRYYGYRYLHPELGRWMSRDPIEERGGVNLYQAILNDFISKRDTDGRRVVSDLDDALEIWRSNERGTHTASQGIIDDIKDEKAYKKFLREETVKKAKGKVSCGNSGEYPVNAKSSVFQAHNLVVGRVHVNATGSCSWSCENKCSWRLLLWGCGCDCKVSCDVSMSFKDTFDFTPHETDPWPKQRRDQFYGWVAGEGSLFDIVGSWSETVFDDFSKSCTR